MRLHDLHHDLPRRTLYFEIIVAALLIGVFWLGASGGKLRASKTDGLFDRWRAAILARVDEVFDPPASHWVAGLLLGADQGFSPKWRADFRRTGTSHLTAVSGYNVGVVLNGAIVLLRGVPLGRRGRVIVALACVAAFVLLTGSPGSVLRAAVMIAAVEAGRLFGRPVRPLRALLFAALCIGVCSPRVLAQDRGFQLSALASFGLVTLGPPMVALFRRFPKFLAEWAGQSLAATIATAPLIALMSGSYSLVALPANLAVTVFIPPIMAGGALVIAVSVVSSALARWCAGFADGLFTLPLVVIRAMASWPAAAVTGPAAFGVLAAVELLALVFAWRWRRRVSLRHALAD